MNTIAALVVALCAQQGPVKKEKPSAQAPPAKTAPLQATQKPEEFETHRTKTGITLPRGTFEGDVVLSFLSWDDYRDDDYDLDVRVLRFEATYGITEWVTAEVELPFVWVDPSPGSSESGVGDLVLEGKMSFNTERHSPAGFIAMDLAGGMRIQLPTGDEDDGTGEEDPALTLFGAASRRFLPWLVGHAELYLTLQSEERPEHGVNVAADFHPWMPELSLVGAINLRFEGTERTEFTFIPGAEWRFAQPLKGMSVGIGLPLGLTSDSPDWGFILDFSLRL